MKLKKIHNLALISFLIISTILTNQGWAADSVIVLKKGEKTPTDGVFYSNASHASLVSKLQLGEKRCELKIQLAVQRSRLQFEGEISRLKVDLEAERKKLKITNSTLNAQKKLLLKTSPYNSSSWWKHPTFLFTSGFFAAIIFSGLTFWGVVELVKEVEK